MYPGGATIALHSTTRAEGMPAGVVVASTMALGFGWFCASKACASHAAAIFKGSPGSGSASSSVCAAGAFDIWAMVEGLPAARMEGVTVYPSLAGDGACSAAGRPIERQALCHYRTPESL